jgi:hypothetical protein
MSLLIKILLTIAAIQYGVVPPIVDFTESHVFNGAWPPHARFHMVWLVLTASMASLTVVLACWLPSQDLNTRLQYACVPGWLVLVGFFGSTGMLSSYQGTLTDMAEPIMVFGIDGNLFSFSIAALFQLVATALAFRSR